MPPKYINKLQGKRVVVIGGTSGIGFATAEAAVEYGAIVVVASSKQDKVDRAVQRILREYPEAAGETNRIQGKTVDLGADDAEEQIEALFDFATDGGRHKLDHVVSTAGDLFRTSVLAEVTRADIEAPFKVRLGGTLLAAKVAMRYLAVSPQSSFTLTSGVSDTKPTVGWTVVAPLGAAQKGLTHALAHDMKPVRVNCVCPGAVQTELLEHFGAGKLEQMIQMYRSKTLTDTVGTPSDLTNKARISVMMVATMRS
jgi:NAD(P)-dependent dehydrogenase (short-subunit alcohol dehydrogenase family)